MSSYLIGLIVFSVLAFLVFAVFISKRDTQKRLALVEASLSNIEFTYADFIEKKIEVLYQNKTLQNTSVEALAQDTLDVLMPQLDGLVSLLNSHKFYSDELLRYDAMYFESLVSRTTEFIHQRYNNEKKYLGKREEELLYETAKKAIISDLKQRIVNYQYDSGSLDLPTLSKTKLKDDRESLL